MESFSDYLNIFKEAEGGDKYVGQERHIQKGKQPCLRENGFEYFLLCDKDPGPLLCFI